MTKAFSLMEILVVVALLALMGLASIYFFNPITQIQRSRDTARKNDLAMIKRAIEDFYNDTGRYPKAVEICYDNLETRTDSYGKPARICHICSHKMSYPYNNFQAIPALKGKSICSPSSKPNSSAEDYLYDYDNSAMTQNYSSISWARVYTKLQYKKDRSISEVECGVGCGPAPFFPYNYGITTGNVDLERKTSLSCGNSVLYQFDLNNQCNICRSSDKVNNCIPTRPVFIDSNCTRSCQL